MSDRPAPTKRAGQTVPRRHHYIPQMVQRRFAGPDGQLWSFDKCHPERGVERRPIKRLFQMPHLYTVRRQDGTRDTSTETRLSVIESRAAPVIARVVTDARAGRATAFSRADHLALVDLFVAQLRRSPDFHRAVLTRQAMADFIADRWAQWESLHGPVSEEERALLTDPKFMLEGRREVIAQNAADRLEKVTPAMFGRGFTVVRLGAPQRSFILGSSPFARFRAPGSGRQDLGEPEAELWLPVAHDVALVSYGAVGSSRFLELRGDRGIRQVNAAIVHASTVFASASRELVEAYARTSKRGLRVHGPWEAS